MLPIDAVLPELLATLDGEATVLLQAPTGSGKTTRVPPALLDAAWRNDGRILMLEPRRLAARSAARFMAAQLGESPGQTVGYRTRLDTQVSAGTRIEVVTEGILTRMIQGDPSLAGYAAVLFDEFHERSLQADLGLALVRESQQALRDDLRVVVMSATLETGRLARLLDDCPVVTAEGRSYPVDLVFRPPDRRRTEAGHVTSTVVEALAAEPGSALVFLPGMREIRQVARQLGERLPGDTSLHLLHGQLSAAEQDAAIRPAANGKRKVVLASAIAESSLTIEGIRIVVDAGWQRRASFDPNSGMTRLVTERVSKASAEQRRGRAGRLEPGRCYRLWSENEDQRLAAQTPPEIASADLAPVVLELARWGVTDPMELAWLDPPPAPAWNQARDLLVQLDALDEAGRITAEGSAMLNLGIHPRLAHMVRVGRRHGMGRTAAELAALLGERDARRFEGVDLTDRLRDLRRSGRRAPAVIRRMVERLAQGQTDRADSELSAGTLTAAAWPDRVARRRSGQRGRFLLANGRGAWLDESDALAGSDYLVACELDGEAREARIFRAAALDRDELETVLGDRIRTEDRADWDEARGTVVARRERRLGSLVLESTELDRPDPATVEAGLLEAARRKGIDALPWTEDARQLQARVGLLASLWPDDWPTMDDDTLARTLDDWLPPWLGGMLRWRDLQRLDLVAVLRSRIDPVVLPRLDELAPARLALPDGRRARLDYRTENPPTLAIKLQAMFGCRQTPTVADGRVPVQLHLLSPAGRPLAVTADLSSFWTNAYPQVRKDMRGRYPKHDWPESP